MPPKSRSGKRRSSVSTKETSTGTKERRSSASTRGESDENAPGDSSARQKAKKSRSGQRKKEPAASAEALKSRNENTVPVREQPSRGRAAQAQAQAPAKDFEEQFETEAEADLGGDLFDALRAENAAMMLQARDWRVRYNANEVSGIAEIYSLLAKAAGCSSGVTAIEMQRADCLSIMNRVVSDMAAGQLYGEDPLNKRSKEFKGFKTNFLQFIDHCIREASETGDLYDGTLFLSWLEIISTCSSSKARPLRAAATSMGLQVITSLIAVVNNVSKARDLKQNQMDSALKETNGGKEMLKSLKAAIATAQEQIEVVEKYMQDVFTQVFTHRFRDCDDSIRAACMTELGKWMMKLQLVFLTDFYLKYLGWNLNDKSAAVRLEVLLALKTLASSESHLAMMDTFVVRFRPRIAEMLRDVDPEVVAEAIRLSAILHERSELDPGHMNVVMSLLLDKNQMIRNTAARAMKTLMPTLIDAYCKQRKMLSDQVDDKERQLQGITQLLGELGNKHNAFAKAIDGLWGVYKVLEDPEFIANMLLKDITMDDAATFANILVLVIQKSLGEEIVKPSDLSTAKTAAAKQRHAIENTHEQITLKISAIIQQLLIKYQAEEHVIGPLVEVVRYIKLERYSLSHAEHEFTELANQVKDIFFKHSNERVLEACGDAFNYFTNEGFEAIKPFAQPVLDSVVNELSVKLSPVLKKIRTGMSKSDPAVADENEGYAFELRMAISRVRALISKCNISAGIAVFSELSQYISDASRSLVVGPLSVSMACSSYSFMLIWRALELMENDETTAEQVKEHIAERDAFVSHILHILRRSQDLFAANEASANKVVRAVIATICDMVLYYYNSSTLPTSHPAHVMRLSLSPTDSSEVWSYCTSLITPVDTNQDADLAAARLAYRMATHDEKIAERGALGADFLSNFKIGGPWIDAAIRTYCGDLRRTGPQVLVRALLTALRNAYEEVLNADLGNRQLLIDAYSDLAVRLSDMFTLSSRRDRFVMRIMFQEAVNFVLNPEPVYERFPFLAYGLSPFLTKLSAVDAKVLSIRVDDAIGKIDDEDVRSTPLIDFADKLSTRSKGATAQGPMKARRHRSEKNNDAKGTEDAMEQDDDIEQPDEDDDGEDEEDTTDFKSKKGNKQTLNDGPVEEPAKRSRRK